MNPVTSLAHVPKVLITSKVHALFIDKIALVWHGCVIQSIWYCVDRSVESTVSPSENLETVLNEKRPQSMLNPILA